MTAMYSPPDLTIVDWSLVALVSCLIGGLVYGTCTLWDLWKQRAWRRRMRRFR